jgi:ribosome biogenesis GTPase / thiamine phosphate phosphatase
LDKFELGWNSFFEENWKNTVNVSFFPGRVISEQKNLYKIQSEKGEFLAYISGKMMYQLGLQENFPAVGDWVILELPELSDRCVIHGVLPRKSVFKRKEAGHKKEEQVVAANIDYVFIVSALDHDFNLRRIERYLALTWESGAVPILLLNKADLALHLEEQVNLLEKISFGASVHVISCYDFRGFESLSTYDKPGMTIALLGSSGVGKSSIINHLLGGNIQHTQGLRKRDNGGKHTTTSRELFRLPKGGLMIDTPGMRELQLTSLASGITESFQDIEVLSKNCRYTNCQHRTERDCAVLLAIEKGVLDPDRLKSFHKLQRENSYISQKENKINNDKKNWLKTISKLQKQFKKTNY